MKYRLQDLIDIPLLQQLQDRLNVVYSFPAAIIDNEGNVLTATAWQDVCTKFHRTHPECSRACQESDRYILSHLDEANPAVTYRCPHGLVDNATPIVIDGMHLGNYFTGQFFLEPPDMEYFRRQAARYGFDEEAYLEAVRRVPVWSEEKLHQYLDFIKGFTEILAGIGLKNLQEAEARKLIAEKERALEETHAFSQQIIDSAQEGIVVYDANMRYAVWNPFMERLSNKTADEVLGKHFSEVFPFLEDVGVVEQVKDALDGKGPGTVDFLYGLPNGTTGWVSDTCAPLYAKDGRIIGALATVRDITDRKVAEKALEASETRFRQLVQRVPLPLALFDAEGLVTYLNDRFTQVFGYTLSDIPTTNDWWQTAYPNEEYRTKSRQGLASAIAEAAAREEDVAPQEHQIVCKDGADRTVELSGIVLDGDALITFTDVTERRRQEAALLTMQKLDSLGTLAGGIAHDFNNVLAGILGNLSLLKLQVREGSEEAEIIREAEEASMTARGLAQQLLTFASGGAPITKVLDVGPVVRSAAAFAARGSGALCTVEVADEALPVRGDPEQLSQVVQNLVINAGQAMPDGGTIAVSAGLVDLDEHDCRPLEAGRYVRVRVVDEGCGIPASKLSRIFDPYFTTKTTGQGLGLAVCHSIISKHDGHIVVDSVEGEGTTFSVYLPAVSVSRLHQTVEADAPRAGAGRILVMDDEPRVLRLLGRMLTRLGYESEAVTDGAAAIAAYEDAQKAEKPFDAVIMDLTIMGGMGGQETLSSLQSLHPGVKAIVSSGYATDPVMSDCSSHGFCGVLAKPYRIEEVSRVLAEVIRS